ncbi:hypothetical protein ABRP09_00415 (plasmid) [Clavibacter michiganensis]|uniref:hypothetical protein n=1 Tax=Clavibacter michiganensis TaxID=28447 RepID=UPI00292DD3E6|nr:hypothetical protein [Clavibacter michiganensis]
MTTESRDHRRRVRQWILVIVGAGMLVVAIVRAMNGAGLEIWMVGLPIVWVSFLPDLVNARWQRQREAQRVEMPDATPATSSHPASRAAE